MKTRTLLPRIPIALGLSLGLFAASSALAGTLTNWARTGTAIQSSTYGGTAVASRAIDGNTAGAWGDNSTTHTVTGNAGEWWQVDLGGVKPIGHIRLWFREDCCYARNENLRVAIYSSTNLATRTLLWETNNAWPYPTAGLTPRDIGFELPTIVNGQAIFVEHLPGLPDIISITECEVFNQPLTFETLTNYARENPYTSTSSSIYNGDASLHGPQQANDGNHMGLTAVMSGSGYWGYSAPDNVTTNLDGTLVDPLPWWQVDLPSEQTVGSVVLWPRRDRTLTRFLDIKLELINAGATVVHEHAYMVQPSGTKYVVNFAPAIPGVKTIKISTTTATPDKFLNLPEVEVFAPLASAPALTFTTNLPASVTAEAGTSITLGPVAAAVDGGIRPEEISYRWYKNGTAIPGVAGSWLKGYATPPLLASGDTYKVQASVPGYGVLSSEVTVITTNTPPTITTNFFVVTDMVRMYLQFSKPIIPATATNPANYVLDGGPTVDSLTLQADGKTVALVIGNLLLGDIISLHVSGVQDLTGATMLPKHIIAQSPQTPINYARSGVATQDSTYGAAVASRAIDGNTSGSWGAASIAATAGNVPGWWEVNLGTPKTIGIIKLYWRTDCCPRNANLDVVIYDTADPGTRSEVLRTSISDVNGLGYAPFTLDLGNGVAGQVVHIEHRADTPQSGPGWSDGGLQLHLAEVMIMPPPSGLAITTSPRSWAVNEGDRVVLRASVTGTTPIAYQWQRNGANVAGATSTELMIAAIAAGEAGTYTLIASNALRVRTSDAAAVAVNPRPALGSSLISRYNFDADHGTNVLDVAPMNPAKTAMHDGLNTGAFWEASATDASNIVRTGVMRFDGVTSPYSLVEAISHPDYDGPATNQSITVTFWMKGSLVDGSLPGTGGYILFDRQSGAQGYGGFAVVFGEGAGHTAHGIAQNLTGGYTDGVKAVDDDVWHHVTLIYQHIPYSVGTVYVDGVLDTDAIYDLPGSWASFRNLMFGRSWDGYWKRFNGYLDDIRVYNRVLNAAEVAQVIAPDLSIARSGSDIVLSWDGTGYILQQNGDVGDAAGWGDIGGATSSPVTLPLPGSGNKFYRLKKQ
jgi:hypothetical protein